MGINDPWTKPKGARMEGGRGVLDGAEGSGRGKMETTIPEQQ